MIDGFPLMSLPSRDVDSGAAALRRRPWPGAQLPRRGSLREAPACSSLLVALSPMLRMSWMAGCQGVLLPEPLMRMHPFHGRGVDIDQALDIHQAPAPDSALIFPMGWAEGGYRYEA